MSEQGLRETVLIADCGNTTTRVALLDIVGGRYRFIASGQAPSTAEPPSGDINIGLFHAIRELEAVTGRQIIGSKGQLLIPSQQVSGVDTFVATTSAAPALRTVLVGLTDDFSLASARRVAQTTYCTIVDVLGLADTRQVDQQIRALIDQKPDVVLITGGTDDGASDRVLKLTETISLALALLDQQISPPTVIYAGNASLRPVVAERLNQAQLRVAENVRPQVDVEYLDSAKAELCALYETSRLFELPGAEELNNLAQGGLMTTAKAFGRTVQYLGAVLGRQGNVIGVDVGSATVTMAAVVGRELQLTVRGDLGMGHHLPHLLEQISLQRVMRWLPQRVSESELRSFVANKALFPHAVPLTAQQIQIELALARELIGVMLPVTFPGRFDQTGNGLLHPVEMILASGATLVNIARPGQAALALLDALQPVGLCTLTLDSQGLAPALGAVAGVLPVAAVQVIESGAFRELGGVIAPIGQASPGEVILHLKMIYESGSELEVEVEFGSLEVLPLPAGQSAELQLRPQRRFDVGAGPGRSARRRVFGGGVGLIVDARGRPLQLPEDAAEREIKVQQWLWDMGG